MFVNIYKSHEVNREAVACKVSRDRWGGRIERCGIQDCFPKLCTHLHKHVHMHTQTYTHTQTASVWVAGDGAGALQTCSCVGEEVLGKGRAPAASKVINLCYQQACRVKSELQSFAGRPKNVVRKKNKSVIKHLSFPPMRKKIDYQRDDLQPVIKCSKTVQGPDLHFLPVWCAYGSFETNTPQ